MGKPTKSLYIIIAVKQHFKRAKQLIRDEKYYFHTDFTLFLLLCLLNIFFFNIILKYLLTN